MPLQELLTGTAPLVIRRQKPLTHSTFETGHDAADSTRFSSRLSLCIVSLEHNKCGYGSSTADQYCINHNMVLALPHCH